MRMPLGVSELMWFGSNRKSAPRTMSGGRLLGSDIM